MADTDYLAASDGTGNAALMHITSPRTALATIIQVDTVSGVPAFFIGTWGTLGADGFITAASARDFFGHVNAGTLVIDKMAPGNVDGGNTSGQVVVIKPSTPAQNLVGNFVKTALNNFGEGQLLNGKIVPTISSNNLVVSLKTLNGVDPSSTDVVYVRIGNTVRTITAALSVTLAAGTNWFGKGSAPFATVATSFFVYFGYNATDGVTLGLSSTSSAVKYSDFSTTNTDWTYAKISTVTNAASTDVYENVGMINAILGVSATYLWTLPANNIAISQPSRSILQTPSAFNVYRTAAFTPGSGLVLVQHDTKEYDFGNEVDVVTNKGRFTAKAPGLYTFKAAYTAASANNGGTLGSVFFKNGAIIKRGNDIQYIYVPSANGSPTFQGAIDLILNTGDYIEHYVDSNALAATVGNQYVYFSGYMVRPL